eukprot:TRINITY_DN21759_c0_g3_i2.p1 TRINITY_DN21759_c0_g3~~TRINITY_DN21759_c0_g3_i2.p1  ORF type:complete len:69 (-),score=12.55 TRINITY_DN21759_c0_g3_i2:161-367(-)
MPEQVNHFYNKRIAKAQPSHFHTNLLRVVSMAKYWGPLGAKWGVVGLVAVVYMVQPSLATLKSKLGFK